MKSDSYEDRRGYGTLQGRNHRGSASVGLWKLVVAAATILVVLFGMVELFGSPGSETTSQEPDQEKATPAH